jgi:hypothetical protein
MTARELYKLVAVKKVMLAIDQHTLASRITFLSYNQETSNLQLESV